MPIVQIHLVEGRSAEIKAKLISEVTRAVTETLGLSPSDVDIVLVDVPIGNFGVSGKPLARRK